MSSLAKWIDLPSCRVGSDAEVYFVAVPTPELGLSSSVRRIWDTKEAFAHILDLRSAAVLRNLQC